MAATGLVLLMGRLVFDDPTRTPAKRNPVRRGPAPTHPGTATPFW
jgi:hypothetical protein